MRDIHARLKQRHHLGQFERQRPGLAFFTVPREYLRGLLLDLRDKEGFSHLVLLTAVDWMEEGLFQLTYMLNNRAEDVTFGIRVMLDREEAEGDSIHDLWPTAETYQRELKEMFGINFPGSPRIDDEFILEGWTDLPPYRRDFDSLAYSQQTYAERPGRVTHDPRAHMKQKLYPDGV
ncbi:NADH-quinone oxidoreductase subunit C [Aliiruegeria sabulilitoris]|uniref:NADH-quinone oxidoreductase subunit C n=1 Tax=Aliiruegeria sabulilitoris TaxID=1510458 RepID=UPI00082EC10F|nr:NADH-quinone oxidoreductase subunit C [Aliiruegeria sabulilitoris]NDR57723.1 NADH-quinone oxidoreductase subunit C [Pseudoruegeria sp. M32A2M]